MCIGFDLDNPRRNADCGVGLGEGKVPFPRALSILSTRSQGKKLFFFPCFFFLVSLYVEVLGLERGLPIL